MANELNAEMLKVALKSIDEFAARELPDSLLVELDERDEFPEALVRRMSSGEELGIQLLFVPFEYGGMGGGAFDVYRVCERMAAIDLGLATSELATFLGSDPIRVGGTEDQKREYMGRIAKEGVLFAYGATEPEAGSDLGSAEDDRRAGQRQRDRRPAIGSAAPSSGSATAAWPTCSRFWPSLPAGRAGSWSKRAPRASRTASTRTSTASG